MPFAGYQSQVEQTAEEARDSHHDTARSDGKAERIPGTPFTFNSSYRFGDQARPFRFDPDISPSQPAEGPRTDLFKQFTRPSEKGPTFSAGAGSSLLRPGEQGQPATSEFMKRRSDATNGDPLQSSDHRSAGPYYGSSSNNMYHEAKFEHKNRHKTGVTHQSFHQTFYGAATNFNFGVPPAQIPTAPGPQQ